jgi:alpha-mannosidase
VEESELSKNATVNLQSLFANREIDDVEEVSLSANQKKSQMRKMQWHIRGAAGSQTSSSRDRDPMSNKYSVVLAPMEIRTFLIEF